MLMLLACVDILLSVVATLRDFLDQTNERNVCGVDLQSCIDLHRVKLQ